MFDRFWLFKENIGVTKQGSRAIHDMLFNHIFVFAKFRPQIRPLPRVFPKLGQEDSIIDFLQVQLCMRSPKPVFDPGFGLDIAAFTGEVLH